MISQESQNFLKTHINSSIKNLLEDDLSLTIDVITPIFNCWKELDLVFNLNLNFEKIIKNTVEYGAYRRTYNIDIWDFVNSCAFKVDKRKSCLIETELNNLD